MVKMNTIEFCARICLGYLKLLAGPIQATPNSYAANRTTCATQGSPAAETITANAANSDFAACGAEAGTKPIQTRLAQNTADTTSKS